MKPDWQDWQSLSLKEQIAQMIVVRASGHLFDHQIRYPAWEANHQQLKIWLTELNLGGVILLGGSSAELKMRSQQLQSWAKIPLFIAADIEEGIGQRFPGGTWFPPPMALGQIYQNNPDLARQYASQMGEVTGKEALAVGINWLLAPVVDVNNNPDNPAINIRAFGDRPEVVADLTTAFIQGAKSTAVLTTAKHFPGHGDTSTDSHLDLPALNHSESRLAAIELPPFEQAIAAGVDSVMTAHLLIAAWDNQCPATLSRKIVTEILRNRLGFSSLV
ncbi:MAG: glycoside hydrolase family 3 N-terminal domain-containing protein, partial [Waterburya sp.]